MCQIVIGRMGDIRPNMLGFSINQDGYGLAFMKQGHVHIYKSMERKAVQEIMHRLPKSQAVVVHARFATSGVVGTLMSHPYFIANDPIQAHRWQPVVVDGIYLAATCTLESNEEVVFHNGVVGIGTDRLSDTAVAATLLQELPVEEVFSPQDRVVILNGQGHIALNGNVLLHLEHFVVSRRIPENWWLEGNVLLSNPPHIFSRKEIQDGNLYYSFPWRKGMRV